jgi:cyclic pyranopterin phosphate synthase
MISTAPLVDGFGRVHTNLRVSVTDRCNIRCFYCMPAENVQFKPRHELLSFEEIERFVRVVARMGVNKIRLTGGEPLVRHGLSVLVAKLVAVPGIRDVALTTNGLLLTEQATALKAAGLTRLNISLDSLNRETFRRIARREGLERVLAGIAAAQQAGFTKIRLNAVALRGITEAEVVPLCEFALKRGMQMRFIEFMPLDADGQWDNEQVLSGERIREIIEAELGPLVPLESDDRSQPATDYALASGAGTIGFINPVTQPFCHRCNRLRLTAEGQVRNCLFSTAEWDARQLLRDGASDQELADLVRASVGAKRAGHGINSDEFLKPVRAMYQIGG